MPPNRSAEHSVPAIKAPATTSGGRVARAVLPLGILACGLLAYHFLAQESEKAKSPPAEKQLLRTRVTELHTQDYAVTAKTHGVVQPHNEVTLSAQVSGLINQVNPAFEAGSYFSAGDVLLELDPRDYQTAVAVAEARLLSARSALALTSLNHERNLKMFGENLISQAEVDQTAATQAQAEADVNSAAAQVDRAKRDLERTTIRAPFDGRVREMKVGLGQTVGSGTPLGTIFAVDFAEVRLPIAGRELPFLELPEMADDPPVDVELRNALNEASEIRWRGRIIRTEGALDQNSLELFAIARVDDPFGLKSGQAPLRIGQPVVAHIAGMVLTNVIALPRVAVRQLDQIYLVDKQALTLQARTIVPLWSDADHIIVREPGIVDGSLLSTTHLVYTPDGSQVEIIPDIEATPATANAGSQGVTNRTPSATTTHFNKKS